MFGLQLLAVVAILAIAYRKEILSFYSKMVEKIKEKNEKPYRPILSKDTKDFLGLIWKVLLVIVLMIVVFFVCSLIFPGVLGYVLGGVLDFISIIIIAVVACNGY